MLVKQYSLLAAGIANPEYGHGLIDARTTLRGFGAGPMIDKRCTRVALLTGVFLVCASAAFAQGRAQIQPGTTVVTTGAAPVFLMPDSSRVPLRTLPAGMSATVERVQEGWVRITFNDPQFGARTAWIESRFVKPGSAPSPARPDETPDTPAAPPSKPAGQPARAAQRRGQAPSVRLFGGAALDRMTAAESFEAITGSNTVPAFGGGVQAADVWRGLFIEFAAEYSSIDGERVFVFENEVYRLGIPLEIKTLPLDLSAGWRFPLGRVTPFVGGGITFLRYEESSEFAEAEENVREWHRGFMALGGIETRVVTNVHIRADFRYRRIDDALGLGGVSAVFGETKLGGAGGSIKVVFGR